MRITVIALKKGPESKRLRLGKYPIRAGIEADDVELSWVQPGSSKDNFVFTVPF